MLQSADYGGNCRLRNAELRGSFRHALRLRHGQKHTQVAQLDAAPHKPIGIVHY
jgi:hypothetical protein